MTEIKLLTPTTMVLQRHSCGKLLWDMVPCFCNGATKKISNIIPPSKRLSCRSSATALHVVCERTVHTVSCTNSQFKSWICLVPDWKKKRQRWMLVVLQRKKITKKNWRTFFFGIPFGTHLPCLCGPAHSIACTALMSLAATAAWSG